jgi:dTMP kinase
MSINRIALLGIDGSGKSTMSKIIKEHLETLGYTVTIVPFHKWVIADKLRNVFGGVVDKGRKDRNSQYSPPPKSFSAKIKPPIAFIDNILFYKMNAPKQKNEIFIYDRFICATQIKFAGLGYTNNWFKKMWWSYKPDFAIIFDVDVDESVKRQHSRNDPYAYTQEILIKEKEQYLQYASKHKFPVVKSRDIDTTRAEVLVIINDMFKKITY